MDRIERAKKYIESAGGAISGSGGHDHTFGLACNLLRKIGLSSDELFALLHDYHNPQCSPPWSDKELRHKVDTAMNACAGLIGSQSKDESSGERRAGKTYVLKPAPGEELKKPAVIRFVFRGDRKMPIPEEIDDGARKLLRAAFREHEGVRICHASLNGEGKEVPGRGLSLTREEWLEKLDAKDGHVNDGLGIFSEEGNPGVYCAINPIAPGETLDKHITSFRHMLLEFDDDKGEKQWQWDLMLESELPITAVIDSGRRSLHAWVRVDARDRQEFDERVAAVYDYVADYSPDEKNKNPGRLSRLAGCVRFDSRQKLLALDIGKPTFAEWLGDRAMDGVGEPLTLEELMAFDPENDPDCLLGERWLGKGGSLVVVAPSGIGKSSLATQAAFTWALGYPLFGISPKKALKSMIIQAENDRGDIAEQTQGVINGMNIDRDEYPEMWNQLAQNVIFIRDSVHTAEAFCSTVAKLIDRHKPDLVWVDPLLSFIGGDVSKQEVCSRFLRNGLNPIAESTGVIFVLIHHTAKPPKEKAKAMDGWTASDFAYLGAGSSDITNWARAVVTLQQIDDEGNFQLSLVKRGKRAAATTLDGKRTNVIPLRHSETGIRWVQQNESTSDAYHAEGRNPSTLPWFQREWPGYLPSEWLKRLTQREGVKFADLCDACRAYARKTGRGPASTAKARDLINDLADTPNPKLPGRNWLERYEPAKGEAHPKTKFLFRVHLAAEQENEETNFDDVPEIDETPKPPPGF